MLLTGMDRRALTRSLQTAAFKYLPDLGDPEALKDIRMCDYFEIETPFDVTTPFNTTLGSEDRRLERKKDWAEEGRYLSTLHRWQIGVLYWPSTRPTERSRPTFQPGISYFELAMPVAPLAWRIAGDIPPSLTHTTQGPSIQDFINH